MTRLSVPANLVLLGEYAVTEPGGLGVVIALERRIEATLTPAPRLEIAGEWVGGGERWPPGRDESLPACAARACADHLSMELQELLRLPLRISVDSRPLFGRGGRKGGLGSSAAATVAICHALMTALQAEGAGRGDQAAPLDSVFAASLAAHRAFQGGRGSGYDVAASLYGGVGRFEGGKLPHHRRIELPWLPSLLLFDGNAPVATSSSVGRYQEWKRLHPAEARRFLEESNRCVEGFLAAGDLDEGCTWFARARAVGVDLGEAIGVSARIEAPPSLAVPGGIAKAVGAGNELGVLLGNPGPVPVETGEGIALLPVSMEGVRRVGDGS